MKKFLSIAIAVMMCVCLMVPSAFAAEEGIASILGGIDFESLEAGDIAGIITNLIGVEDLDIEGIMNLVEGEDEDVQVKVEQALQDVQASVPAGIDLSQLAAVLPMDISAFTQTFSGTSEAQLPAILNTISSTMSGVGVDMSSFDLSSLGSFDITSILGGLTLPENGGTAANSGSSSGSGNAQAGSLGTGSAGNSKDLASGITDTISGLADSLLGGLSSLGIDTKAIEGLLDNEIVNFFANMYIGFIGDVEETTTAKPTTTTAPVDTGDTSSALVAMATIGLASVAAGVCLKKKEEE